jgi:co-chaperonin GroES (HSP10)
VSFQDEKRPETEAPEAEPMPRMRLDYVLVEREKNVMSDGGLHIPDTAGLPYVFVRAVGPGCHLESGTFLPTDVKVGDRVLIDSTESDIGVFRWGKHEFGVIRECFLKAVLPIKQPEADRIVVPGGQKGAPIISLT